MNSCNLVGRLTKDPELRYTTDNLAIAKYTLAVPRRYKKEEANFINVIAFKKSAEYVSNYFKKGMRVFVTGELQTGKYEKDGITFYTAEIVQDSCGFADGKREGVGAGQDKPKDGFIPVDDSDDEFPF